MIRFFTGINCIRGADAIVKRNVGIRQHIEAMMGMKTDDTTTGIFHCTIRTNLDVPTLYGSMGREGRLFRTIRFDNTTITCGHAFSVVALASDATNEAVAPWRIEAMGQSDYAVLLSTPGKPVRGQPRPPMLAIAECHERCADCPAGRLHLSVCCPSACRPSRTAAETDRWSTR
jgi:hypothetical protein